VNAARHLRDGTPALTVGAIRPYAKCQSLASTVGPLTRTMVSWIEPSADEIRHSVAETLLEGRARVVAP